MALAFEREIYGWPAQLCEDGRLAFHGSQVFGDCVRYGEELMRISFNSTSVAHMGNAEPTEKRFGVLIKGEFLQIRKFPHPPVIRNSIVT